MDFIDIITVLWKGNKSAIALYSAFLFEVSDGRGTLEILSDVTNVLFWYSVTLKPA